MILPVLQYPDPRLARICLPVEGATPKLRELVENMVETMYARDGIGLAAPQIGEPVRLVVIDVSGPEVREELMVLVNPKLTDSGPEVESEEGCLSVPDFRTAIRRSEKVHVEAQDLDGNPISFDADGLLAICLQHECDHLDGKLFIDRMSRLKRGMYDRRLNKKEKGK